MMPRYQLRGCACALLLLCYVLPPPATATASDELQAYSPIDTEIEIDGRVYHVELIMATD